MKKLIAFVSRARWHALVVCLAFVAHSTACPHAPEPVPPAIAGPLSAQPGIPVTNFAGQVDPTNPAWSGGMQVCSSSCSSTVANNNCAAFQAAANAAHTNSKTLYVPPNDYPMGVAAGRSYCVDLGTLNGLTIAAYGARFRSTVNAASAPYTMFWARNVTGLRWYGSSFSQRDVTNSTADTVALLVGDGGSTLTDNTLLSDLRFNEGVGGDYVRLDGGASGTNVDRTTITLSFFENGARAGIDVRPGVRRLQASLNFFKGNANRDLWFEASGADNVIGQAAILGNIFEHYTGTQESVTLDGNGTTKNDEQTLFRFNKVFGGSLTAANVSRTLITTNSFIANRAGSSTALISLSGHVTDTWVAENYLYRGASAIDGVVIRASSDLAPANLNVARNRVYQYGTSNGIDVSGTSGFTITDNDVSYHNTTADAGTGTTGFIGIYCAGDGANPCAGTIAQNRIKSLGGDAVAQLDVGTLGLTPNITTHIASHVAGLFGNNYQVRYVADGATACGANTNCRTEGSGLVTIHFKPATTTIATADNLVNGSQFVDVASFSTGGATVMQATDAFAYTSLAGGGPQAGRGAAGIAVLAGSGTTGGITIVRDNSSERMRAGVYSDLEGGAAWPSGLPIVTRNWLSSGVNDVEGGLKTWRADTTPDDESFTAAGPIALSISRHTSFISQPAGSQSYTLADGLTGGFVKHVKIKGYTSGTGTLTPAHMADGSTHTITWTANGGFVDLGWDSTSSTYRVLASSGVTVN